MSVTTARMCGPAVVAEQRHRARWRPRGPIVVVQAVPAARGAETLAQELAGLRGEQADVQVVPLHLHAAIEMDRALAVPVIAKRFERERSQGRLLLSKHHGDLQAGRVGNWRGNP